MYNEGLRVGYIYGMASALLLAGRFAAGFDLFKIVLLIPWGGLYYLIMSIFGSLASFDILWGLSTLFLLNIESVFIGVSNLYSFYDSCFVMLGRIAEFFFDFGTGGIGPVFLTGFSITSISLRALPIDLALPDIYFFDYILKTCMPSPNISWGTFLSNCLSLAGILEFCFIELLLFIEGKYINFHW